MPVRSVALPAAIRALAGLLRQGTRCDLVRLPDCAWRSRLRAHDDAIRYRRIDQLGAENPRGWRGRLASAIPLSPGRGGNLVRPAQPAIRRSVAEYSADAARPAASAAAWPGPLSCDDRIAGRPIRALRRRAVRDLAAADQSRALSNARRCCRPQAAAGNMCRRAAFGKGIETLIANRQRLEGRLFADRTPATCHPGAFDQESSRIDPRACRRSGVTGCRGQVATLTH